MTKTRAKPAPAPAPAAEDVTLHTPGDEGAMQAAEPSEPAADDKDSQIAALQAENTGLKAMIDVLQDKLDAAEDSQPAAPPPEPRLIGENWGAMTAAQAKAAGCTKTVLCTDGYFVPGA